MATHEGMGGQSDHTEGHGPMKPRRVIITIEMTTVEPMAILRDPLTWVGCLGFQPQVTGEDVHEVLVYVMKDEEPNPRKKVRR
jgi:hypothetical protein